jgi:ADP-heptose:LPS heptosyltransferase
MPQRTDSIPIQRLQAADRILGPLALLLLQPWRWQRRIRRRNEQGEPRRVLLIKFWGIGSLQLLTPAVQALRERHPGARLELLTLAENGDFATGLGVFDEVLRLDVRCTSWLQVFGRIFRLLLELRDRSFDLVYDFEFFTRFSAVVAFLAGAPRSAGFATASVWRGRLHTTDVPFNRYWHVARNFRALAGGEDGTELSPEALRPFNPTPGDLTHVEQLLGVGPACVVFNVNAGRLSLERRWPSENFIALGKRLLAETDRRLVLVGAPSEREYVAAVAAGIGANNERVVDLSGQLSIGQLAALLESAALVLTNDSGPMHVAAALGTPTLGLFGPETPQMYSPLGARATALYRPTVCSPCINVHNNKVSTCIHGRPECLVNLTVEDVWQSVELELAGGPGLLHFPGGQVRRHDA